MELLKVRKDGTYVMKSNTDFPYGSKYDGKTIPTGSIVLTNKIYSSGTDEEKVYVKVNEDKSNYLNIPSFGMPYVIGYFPVNLNQIIFDTNCPIDLVSSYNNIFFNKSTYMVGNKIGIEAKVDNHYQVYTSGWGVDDYDNIHFILPNAKGNRGEFITIRRSSDDVKSINIYQNYDAFLENDLFINIFRTIPNGIGLGLCFYSDGDSWIPFILQ